MSSKGKESEFAVACRLAVAMLLMMVCWGSCDGNGWLFVRLMLWQAFHMYVIGKKAITFDNFDGADLLTGIPVIYFLFQCPVAYLLSAPAIYLITRKRSARMPVY